MSLPAIPSPNKTPGGDKKRTVAEGILGLHQSAVGLMVKSKSTMETNEGDIMKNNEIKILRKATILVV